MLEMEHKNILDQLDLERQRSGEEKQELSKAEEKEYKDIAEYCYSATKEEIAAKDYSLVPSKYIEFKNHDEDVDFDQKMSQMRDNFTALLKQEEKSKSELLSVFEELGYEITL